MHAIKGVERAYDKACNSSDIAKPALERRSQPQRDALLAFKLLAHYVNFAQWHGAAKANKWKNIA